MTLQKKERKIEARKKNISTAVEQKKIGNKTVAEEEEARKHKKYAIC